MSYNLKWTNKFSGETGFVKKVMKVKGYFVNTFDQADAKTYKTVKDAEKDIEVITSLGEAEDNDFTVVE